MATTSTEDRQVKLAQARGIGEYIEFDNLVTPDCEAHDRRRLSSRKPRNHSGGPVHQHPLCELGELRKDERLLSHGLCTANLPRHTRRHATAIGSQHDLWVKHRSCVHGVICLMRNLEGDRLMCPEKACYPLPAIACTRSSASPRSRSGSQCSPAS